jgi:Fur family ferric uptake transcriptional regulator
LFDITGCMGSMASLVPPGFKVREHEITLFGTCAECGKEPPGGAGTDRR